MKVALIIILVSLTLAAHAISRCFRDVMNQETDCQYIHLYARGPRTRCKLIECLEELYSLSKNCSTAITDKVGNAIVVLKRRFKHCS
ncbi:Uncharacterised protein r2_g3317 [Pycnogonum litorale]